MKLEKTIFKDARHAFTKDVMYVGFRPFHDYDYQTPKIVLFLREITRCAGYSFAGNSHNVSSALDRLRSTEKNPAICIIQSGYIYGKVDDTIYDTADGSIPKEEFPFCNFEGLSYFQKRKKLPVNKYKQGLQLARIINREFPETRIAIYDSCGSKTQTKQLGFDYIESIYGLYLPLNILDYLRNQNEEVFEK